MKNFLLFAICFLLSGFVFGQGTETFSNIPTNSSTSYNDRTWTGDDGSTWTATKSKTSESINGSAIAMNDDVANVYVESGTISGGIGSITISTQRKFSGGTGNLDVLINGTSVGTVPYSDVVQTTTISAINTLGDIVIRIDNNIGGSNSGGADRVAIDDIIWTAAPVSGNPVVSFDTSTDSDSEGSAAAGNSTVLVPVTMNMAPSADVIVAVASTDGTATTADNDYLAISTSLTFTAAETYPNTKNISLTVVGDDTVESDEDLTLALSITSGTADLGTATHTFTILNDDTAPVVNVVVNELMANATTEGSGEWVELYNNEATAVDLSCFVLTDGDWDISIPSGNSIPANGWFTIGKPTAENGDGSTFTPDLDLSSCSCANSLSISNGAISFTNGGEFVALFDGSANFVDGFTFGSPSSTNLPSAAGTETVNAQGGCAATSVDIGSNASFSGGGIASRANNFEDAGGATGPTGNNTSVGRFPDGSATFRQFSTDEVSPGAINVLPVDLLSFDAKAQNREIKISWATSMELNNSHFKIQHSTDNRNFTTIGKEAGAGNSDININYSFTHETPANGINYYRLQQFDFDGQSEYSQVVSVRFGKGTGISVYPNPVQAEVTIALGEEFATNATAEIISQNGSTVLTETFTAKSFTQTMKVNNLPAGVYVLRVVNGNEVYTERFVKK